MDSQRQRIARKSARPGGGAGGHCLIRSTLSDETVFGYPRDFLQNHFVYLVISPRARGLSIGLNLNPIVRCNLECVYCEVDRGQAARSFHLDLDRMAIELSQTLELARGGWLRQWPRYARLPQELLQVRHVALSGDGEPTLSNSFLAAMQKVVQVREADGHFKLVLITNSTALDAPQVQQGWKLLAGGDEIWAKLDGGTQPYLSRVNGPGCSLEKILDNILLVGRQRPVIIQSLFPALAGEPPPAEEIQAYAQRLKELKQAGAQISLVQIYSATRPMPRAGCGHLALKTLSQIAQTVRQVTGLRAEVF